MEFRKLVNAAIRIDEIRKQNERRITALATHPYQPLSGESLGQLAGEQYELLKFLTEHEELCDWQFVKLLRKGQFLYKDFYPEQELGQYERSVGVIRYLLSQVQWKKVNSTLAWAENERNASSLVAEAMKTFPVVTQWQPRLEVKSSYDYGEYAFWHTLHCSYQGNPIELERHQRAGEYLSRTWDVRLPNQWPTTVSVPEGVPSEEANDLLIKAVEQLLGEQEAYARQLDREADSARRLAEEMKMRRWIWALSTVVVVAVVIIIILALL